MGLGEATAPNGATATFTATAVDSVDGSTAATCAPASGSTFPLGATTVTCSSTDKAGNTGTAVFTVTVADTTAPDTSLTGTLPANPSKQKAGSFSFTGTDLVGVAGYECRLDTAAFTACSSPWAYSGLADGSHTVQVRARDAAGNRDTTPASYTWTVDATAPVVTAATVTVNATSPTGAAVPFTATATDTNPANPTVTCTPASGSTFAIGTTTVTCSATDLAGNTGTARFTVTVKSASAQLTDLQTTVQDLSSTLDTRKNLLSLLQNAQAALTKGSVSSACDKLTSFIGQVQAQSGKKIPTPTADSLVSDTRRIMAVLGCP